MTQRKNTRRDFLKKSAVTAAAAAPFMALPRPALSQDSANDRLRIGCIGVGGMGRGDANGHSRFGDIVSVCDVDRAQADRCVASGSVNRTNPEIVEDYRKVIDRDDIDVVSVVTPDHWHVKICIEALMAGKHVFCQKPLTLTLEENQLIRNACKKYNDRVFFIGTQQRSDRNKFLRAINMVQQGLLGDIKTITVGINGGPGGGPFAKTDPPSTLNWDAWLGQAPKVDYIPQRCHGNFRWWYEYSGGKFTDWGAHHIDIALWAMSLTGEGQGPTEFDGTDAKHPCPYEGGHATVDNYYNTANDYAVHCKLPTGTTMTVTSRGDNGIMFEGTKGRIFVNRGKIVGQPIEENWDEGKYTEEEQSALYKGKPCEGHKNNFYRCIAEGGLPVSDVYSHVQVMNSCHLCAIAARLGRIVRWDPKAEKIIGDAEAATFFAREQRAGYEIKRV